MSVWPAPLWGAVPTGNDEAKASADADALIEQGISARRAGADQRALELFLRAGELQPESTRVRVHLAATYQALGRWEEADQQLTLALRDPADPYIQKNQAILATARRTVDEHMATLELGGGPPGTEVWLNGRALGHLPLKKPVRVEAGVYTLEARSPNHYPVTRTLTLAGGSRSREYVSLAPRTSSPGEAPTQSAAPVVRNSPTWLPWTFVGLTAAAGTGATLALVLREQHLRRWNDDSACLPQDGRSRGEACGSERDAAQRAETWMWIGSAAAGAFAAASVVSFMVFRDASSDESPTSAALRCGAGFALVSCEGRF